MEENTDSTQVLSSDALERIERANTDMQIDTAKKYPRKMAVVKKEMLSLATLDQETAATCFYTLKRKKPDGSDAIIQGPSARLAEIAMNSFGNIQAAAQIIGNDGKMITARAVCHDLEKNVRIGVEVKRRITNKTGRTFSDDMQVVTGNAACSIALRNAAFKVIPMALIKPVYDAARKAAVGDAKTLTQRRTAALAAFKDMGVSEDRVFRALNIKGIEDIGLSQLEVLIGMHTAIKDGDTNIDEQFPLDSVAPTMTNQRPAPSLFGAGAGKGKTADKAQEPPPPGDGAVSTSKLQKLQELMEAADVTEAQVLDAMRKLGMVDESLDNLKAIEEFAPSVINACVGDREWKTILNAING